MHDPSGGVQPPLDKHLHLICNSHHYPLIAQLSLDQATRYLIDGPAVVKEVAPVSWTYVSAPQDGTIWLEWLSARQNNGRFPSDGYVWGDPEQAYRQEINGYTIEFLIHQSGFRPGVDHMTSHARTRYHLISKAPNVNAAAPDPSLWIVHYHQAAQNRIMPAVQLPVDHMTRHLMSERRWLESLGRIERRDFMLHDREHWPTISLPNAHGQQMHPQAMYGANQMSNPGMMMAPNRYGQQPFPAQAGPPSAKRQRTHGPGPALGQQEAMVPDTSIEEEEYTAFGDYFDTLTPREISLTRYRQHQLWMEEIFSSPYAANDIVPVDLGLGLMGELKGLTDGIVEETSLSTLLEHKVQPDSRAASEASFTRLSQQQVDDFGNRVQKFLDEGRAEIERMKTEHSTKMRQWQKTHKLTQAERQLRVAEWKEHKSSLFAPTTDVSNGHAEEQQALRVEAVVEDIEGLVGLKLKPHRDAALIEKGGLEEQQASAGQSNGSQRVSKAASAAPSDAMDFLQDSAGGAVSGSSESREKTTTQSTDNVTGAQQTPATTHAPSEANHIGEATSNDAVLNDVEMDLLNDNGMDLDTGDLNFELDDLTAPKSGNEDGDDGNTNAQASSALPSAAEVAGTADGLENGKTAEPSTQPTEQQKSTVTPSGADGADGDLFDESGFDFTNGAGDGAEDGLIDFEGGVDLGIDDSAFGDALHGMDETEGDNTFDEQS